MKAWRAPRGPGASPQVPQLRRVSLSDVLKSNQEASSLTTFTCSRSSLRMVMLKAIQILQLLFPLIWPFSDTKQTASGDCKLPKPWAASGTEEQLSGHLRAAELQRVRTCSLVPQEYCWFC